MSSLVSPHIIIAKVKDLCQRLEFFGIKVGDARKHPQISPVVILKSLLLIPILRLKSLNQLDNYLRLPEIKRFIGSKRQVVVSDSTMERSLKGFTIDSLRMILKAIVRFGKAMGYHKVVLSSGRKLVAGIVDGTRIGKKLCSVFYEIGKVNLLVDVERIKKRGKELEASWKLVEKHLSDVDILIVDGLYYVKKRINWIRSQGKHILIKTKEKSLTLIQDAEELFQHRDDFKDEVEYYEGTQVRDDGKKFSYRVWAVGGLTTDGVDYPLKVAKVEMVNLISKEEETYYLITTWVELTGLEMKQIGQLRWRVENNAFKKGNEQFALKHAFIDDEHGWEAMTLILFIGFNLFEILKTQLREEGIIQTIRKVTYKWISQLIQRSLTIVYGTDPMLCLDSS
jgi:Transposase DDE domain